MFEPGMVMMTGGAARRLGGNGKEMLALLSGHLRQERGELSDADLEYNRQAILDGAMRILSVFKVRGTRYYVITEADHSATTIMLPEEY